MPVERLKANDCVIVRSVISSSEGSLELRQKLGQHIGKSFLVDVSADNLKKCILKGTNGAIFHYCDLILESDRESIKPKGGKFNVQNLVR